MPFEPHCNRGSVPAMQPASAGDLRQSGEACSVTHLLVDKGVGRRTQARLDKNGGKATHWCKCVGLHTKD